jgi:hypothetical protein
MSQHQLSSSDSGRLIQARVGDEILVSLPGLAGAGYEWHIDTRPPELDIVEQGVNTGAIGASQTLFKIEVLAPFTGDLRWSQYRRWEGPTSSIGRFAIRIDAT